MTTDKTTPVTKITTLTTSPVSPSPPVGDCPCGYDIETTAASGDEWDTNPISRPWLVHLEVPKQSSEMVQCTGSLLNRYWIITAAHCFCGTIVHCNGDHMAFQKIFTAKDLVKYFDKGKPQITYLFIFYLSNYLGRLPCDADSASHLGFG